MVGVVVLIRCCPDTVKGCKVCRGARLAPKEFKALVTVTLSGVVGAVVSITQLSVWIPVPVFPEKS